MRRSQLPVVIVVFATMAVVGAAIPAVGLALLASWFHLSISPVVAASLGLVSVVLDVLWRRGVRAVRPWSVLRQVPQDWGHEHGSWWAAVRYGFRMGFGPATILNSWTWWAGFVIVVISGWQASVMGSFVFAVSRALTMMVATSGPRTGEEMARRSARLDTASSVAWPLGLALVTVVSSVLLVSGVGSP